MTQALAVISTILNLVATGIYLSQIFRNHSTPNPSSWAIWVIVNILNTATYFVIVDENIFAVLVVATSTTVVSLIFLVSLIKGKFTKFNRTDIISLVIAVGVGIFWKASNDATISNVALQVIFIISFFPTINVLLKGIAREMPIPWLLGSVAYIMQMVIVLSNPITLWALTFPLIQIIGQGTIAFLAYKQSKSNSLVT